MNFGHSSPSSNDSAVPETAPTANMIAVPPAQRRASSRSSGSPDRRKRRSARIISNGIAIPTAAKMM
jgi:hypothetical protein